MSKLLALVAILLAGVVSAAPNGDLYEDQAELMESEARFLYFNSSSTATSLTLLGALILLGVIFYLVYVGGLLAPVGGSQYSRYGQDYSNGGYGYQNQARYAILCHCLFVQVCHVSSHHTTACHPPRKAHFASSRDPNQPNLSHQPCFFPSSASSRPS